jgi:oligopeptide transport system substrate-binding protein
MRRRALARWMVAPVVLGLVLAGCGSGDSGKDSSEAKVSIDIAEPKHLIPSNTTETSGSQILAALFAPLVDFDADNKPFPVAAESIESTDKKVWTIKLKDGYTFHNGEKVTADSYIDGWNYGAYGPNGQDGNYFFTRIQGYDVMNPADPDGRPVPKSLPSRRPTN